MSLYFLPRTKSAARSAIMMTGTRCSETIFGMIERIDDPQPVNATNPQFRIDDGVGVASHAACTNRMEDRCRDIASLRCKGVIGRD